MLNLKNTAIAEYFAETGSYLFYYLNFHNITDTLLWPETMRAITVEHDPNAFLTILEIEVMY